MATAATWRTEPRYEGLVSDGWYLADGKLCYASQPLVRAVAIGSLLPRQEQIEHVIAELAKAPQDELQEWQELGGVVNVIAGADARRHPGTGINLSGVHCGGWYSQFQKRIVVAADSPIQPPVVALHELGHAIDGIHKLSTTRHWQSVIGRPDHGFNGNGMGETFAQSFALHYHGEGTRAMLSRDVQEFFRRTFT